MIFWYILIGDQLVFGLSRTASRASQVFGSSQKLKIWARVALFHSFVIEAEGSETPRCMRKVSCELLIQRICAGPFFLSGLSTRNVKDIAASLLFPAQTSDVGWKQPRAFRIAAVSAIWARVDQLLSRWLLLGTRRCYYRGPGHTFMGIVIWIIIN